MADTSSTAPAAPPPPAAWSRVRLVTVRVPWPTTVFHHGIDGVESIGNKPIQISQSQLAQVQAKARNAGLELIIEEAK